LAVASNKRATWPPLPPAGVRRRVGRNGQKLVDRDKGSLTEQQTKGTGTTTIQISGIHKTKQQNRCALPSHERVPTTQLPPQPEPSMTTQLCPFLDSGEN